MSKAQTSSGAFQSGFLSVHLRSEGRLCLLLGAITLAVYAQVWQFQFVSMDDPLYVTCNPYIRDGLSLKGIRWAFRTCYYSNWIPFTWLSLMLDATLYGGWAGGYHLTNVGLHVANVLLVFTLLSRATGNTLRSAFVAALFAVHPIHVESVAWIAERKDVLSMLFGLLSLHAYMRYAQHKQRSRFAGVAFVLALCCYCCSLLSKQTFVTLPCVLLLLDFWPLNRLVLGHFAHHDLSDVKLQDKHPDTEQVVSPAEQADSKHRATFLVVEKLPFFAVSVLFCGIAYWSQSYGNSVRSLAETPLSSRILNVLVTYGLYLRKALLPYDLVIFYPHPGTEFNLAGVVASSGLLLAITWFSIAHVRRRPYLLTGWLWYVGSLVPMIGLVQVGIQQMADRYAYLPMLGIYIAVTWLVASLFENKAGARRLLPTAAIGIVVMYSTFGFFQVSHWQNGVVVMRRALNFTKETPFAHTVLGDALLGEFQDDEAIKHFQRAATLAPHDPWYTFQLGFAFETVGQLDVAVAQYRSALKMNERMPGFHFRLGMALQNNGDLAGAQQAFNRALELDPSHASACMYLAAISRWSGDYPRSMAYCKRALELDNESIGSRRIMAANLRDLRRWDEALEQFQHVCDAEPDDEESRAQLAELLEIRRYHALAQ